MDDDSCAEAEDDELVFEMVAETAYVKDRVLGEGMFRARIAGVFARKRDDSAPAALLQKCLLVQMARF